MTLLNFFRMLENLSTQLDKTESRLDTVSKKVAQVLQLSDGNLNLNTLILYVKYKGSLLGFKKQFIIYL